MSGTPAQQSAILAAVSRVLADDMKSTAPLPFDYDIKVTIGADGSLNASFRVPAYWIRTVPLDPEDGD